MMSSAALDRRSGKSMAASFATSFPSSSSQACTKFLIGSAGIRYDDIRSSLVVGDEADELLQVYDGSPWLLCLAEGDYWRPPLGVCFGLLEPGVQCLRLLPLDLQVIHVKPVNKVVIKATIPPSLHPVLSEDVTDFSLSSGTLAPRGPSHGRLPERGQGYERPQGVGLL